MRLNDGRAGGRTLLVASTGGHLEQLQRLSRGFHPKSDEVHWVTHPEPQALSMLAGQSVEWIPYIPPRGYRQMLALVPVARRLLRDLEITRMVSTGAGIAAPFLIQARRLGIGCHYIESAARTQGPSLTGRLSQSIPGVNLYCQYPQWSGQRWKYQGSLFDTFSVSEQPPTPIRRVVVTLGTMRDYRFTRLIERLRVVLPQVMERDGDILWQLGGTPDEGLPGRVVASMPRTELCGEVAAADLVVAHSGIGSALTALECGKRPVLAPRRRSLGEHIDDHQQLIAQELGRRDLVVSVDADTLEPADLRRAAAGSVTTAQHDFVFNLRSRKS